MAKQLKPTEVASVLSQLIKRQKNKCAVCNNPFTPRDRAVLDHCHDTGFIRGALHNSCNGAEGRVKTKARLGHKGVSPADYIIGLGKYLEYHSTPKFPLIHPTHMTEEMKRKLRNDKARRIRALKKAKQ
ncbi:putative recombination endonuclease VII [Alteromonas phage vB_AspP-H4/4]|uniref:Recombination endonuclease VII n=1 Tax=Alteromonas phage vB_AspP-H4/4 TaxID=2928692 RepID=A0A220YL77_9CAUD|nr:endonuclease VII [Alteromonas phage vB_AspP-H4/4]ASL24411.1 putative recombination endonuclease VII [Alteromonas phage vB_AspP-H4/4]